MDESVNTGDLCCATSARVYEGKSSRARPALASAYGT